jgi:hypothetical protein
MEVEKAEFGGALRCAYCALPAIIAWNGLGANKQPDDQKARRTRSFRTGAQSAPAEGRFWPLERSAEALSEGSMSRSTEH